jgi:hypothetical protein
MIFNPQTFYYGIILKVRILAVFAITIPFISYAEAKETNYTFSCNGMHGSYIDESTVRVKIKKPLFGSPKAVVDIMTKANRTDFNRAHAINFDEDFVYFTDSWGFNNDDGYEMCKVGWQRRCLIAKTLFLAADKTSGKSKHRFHSTYYTNCCRSGEEQNAGDEVYTGTCTRLLSE